MSKESCRYKAFISYSHSDKELAAQLQRALERLGKRWYRRRAFEIYRDETHLNAGPEAEPRIRRALEQSEFLIVLCSPDAVRSEWVPFEIETWKSLNRMDRLILVPTDGELHWDAKLGTAGDFDRERSTALPLPLFGHFGQVPIYADIRRVRNVKLDVIGNSDHQRAIAPIARPLHGAETPELVITKELREHRRMQGAAWTTAAVLLVLLAIAVRFWWLSHVRYLEAQARRLVAESQARRASALTVEQSVLLAVEAERMAAGIDAESAMRNAMWLLPFERLRYQYPAQEIVMNGAKYHQTDRVTTVALDSKGTVALSGSYLGQAALCWINRGICRSLPRGHGRIWASAVAPDGTAAALGDESGSVRFYRVRSDSFEPAGADSHSAAVTSAEFSADGRYIATAGADGVVHVYSWPDIANKRVVENRVKVSVEILRFSPDGKILAFGDSEGGLSLYRIGDPAPRQTQHLKGSIAEIAFSPNGSAVAAVTRKGSLGTYDVNTGAPGLDRQVAPDDLYSVAYDRTGSLLTVGAGNNAVIFDANCNRRLFDAQGEDSMSSVAFTVSGYEMLAASMDGGVRLLDVATGRLSGGMKHSAGLNYLVTARGRDRFAIAGRDGMLRIFDLGDSVALDRERGFLYAMNARGSALQQRPDNTLIAYDRSSNASADIPFPDHLTAAAVSPDGRFLATARADKNLEVRRAADGQALYLPFDELPDTLMSVEFSNDGQWVAGGGWNGSSAGFIVVLDAGTGKLLDVEEPEREIRAVAVDAARRRLATGTFDGAIEVRQLSDKLLCAFQIAGSPTKMALSADGHWLAVAMVGGRIEVHEVSGGKLVMQMDVEGDVAGVWFVDGDARLLVARRRGSLIRMLSTPLSAEALKSEACADVGRPLTRDEWHSFFTSDDYRETCAARALTPSS